MSFNRTYTSKEASNRLSLLKARTGLTPNLLGRLGLCLSLNEPGIPNPQSYDEDGREFNRYTLTGEWDPLFIALLRERLLQDGLEIERDIIPQFRAHLNRGVLLLFSRVKSLTDLHDLLPRSPTPESATGAD